MATNSQLVDLLLPISTRYVFGGTRYDVIDTDCSGIVCGAFYKVFGLDPYELGDWTGSQWASGATERIWYGTTPELPWDDMEKGDLIFTSNCSPDFSTGNGSHVGFYTGNPSAPFLSHFRDGGPEVTAVNGVYGNERYYGVKRYRDGEDMTKDELIATRDDGNLPIWQCISWGYTYAKDAAKGVKLILEKLNGLGSGNVDYDKLADKVADKLAKRLES